MPSIVFWWIDMLKRQVVAQSEYEERAVPLGLIIGNIVGIEISHGDEVGNFLFFFRDYVLEETTALQDPTATK